MKKILYIAALLATSLYVHAEGALSGKFAVADGDTIVFAQGNLQFNPLQNIWRFAEHQWDTLTQAENALLAADYNGYIDLFGWGTSGYNNKYPYFQGEASQFGVEGHNDIAATDYDWGVFNAILNGGNKAGEWRTLTGNEWYYITRQRPKHSDLQGVVFIDGEKGQVLLPDDWKLPDGLSFDPDLNYGDNHYTAAQWAEMEKAGAVFLPHGTYWTSTETSNGMENPNIPPFLAADFACYVVPVSIATHNFATSSRDTRYYVRLAKKYVPAEDTPTSIPNANANANAVKIFRNGQVLIVRDGRVYNILGVETK